jgi:hypothetical protein
MLSGLDFCDLFTYMRGIYLIKIKIPGQENKENIHFKAWLQVRLSNTLIFDLNSSLNFFNNFWFLWPNILKFCGNKR